MLAEMRIQGLGVIDDATLDLDPGLTVLTGETGAGKTMVVTGLTLLGGSGVWWRSPWPPGSAWALLASVWQSGTWRSASCLPSRSASGFCFCISLPPLRRRRRHCCSAMSWLSMSDSMGSAVLGALSLAMLAVISRPLLFASLQPELAAAKGVPGGYAVFLVWWRSQRPNCADRRRASGLRADGRTGGGCAASGHQPCGWCIARRGAGRGGSMARAHARLLHGLAKQLPYCAAARGRLRGDAAAQAAGVKPGGRTSRHR